MSILANHLELDPFFHTKICIYCKKEKPLEEFPKHIKNKKDGLDTRCKECVTEVAKKLRVVYKTAPPKPDVCECCKKVPRQWHLDHDHETNEFRGWLCDRCNMGIGIFGDNFNSIKMVFKYFIMTLRRAKANRNIGGIA